MKNNISKNVKRILLSAVAGLVLTGSAYAGTTVSANVTTSTTWTKANSPYTMTKQVYVTNGATLTIEAGVVVADIIDPATNTGNGSLAVCRDGKIKVMGTASDPVIMTSAEDVATWTGSVVTRPATYVTAITTLGNPKTGTWRQGLNEWGNLTLMGNALIGAQYVADGSAVRTYQDGSGASLVTNTGRPTGLNKATMEGLTADAAGDTKVLYGGADDDDSRGEIHYISLRYGGKVIGLGNELNGLSLGGIGRGTAVDHVEVMNNVDDAIEVWGGTVNLKYLSLWNFGDDGLDTDEGWRGKAQFGLIVQGYAKVGVAQGSGVSDNCFEFDGGEAQDAVPVGTNAIYNFTVIGQPDGQHGGSGSGSDKGIAYRDGNRTQFRQCIWMDLGEQLIWQEASEGGVTTNWQYNYPMGAGNSAANFTLTFATPYTAMWNLTNPLGGGMANNLKASGTPLTAAELQNIYRAQSQGNNINTANNQGYLNEITDSVFFNNNNSTAYTNSNNLGPDIAGGKTITVAGGSSPLLGNVVASSSPIKALTRGTVTDLTVSSMWMANVINLDPRAQNDAATSVDTAPVDGFFTPVRYRGAFSKDVNWLLGWTASDAYGFHAGQTNPTTPTVTSQQTLLVSFPTILNHTYTLESSSDGINWSPAATVNGTGNTVKVSDLQGFDSRKLYRVIDQ